MVYIPPPILPQNQDKRKKTSRSPMSNRRLSAESRKENRNTVKKSLGTAQGVSTLKIVLLYSIFGMILNWVLPTLIVGVKPEIPKEQSEFWGTTVAITLTGILLIVTLLKGIILRNTSQRTSSKSQDTNPSMNDKKNE